MSAEPTTDGAQCFLRLVPYVDTNTATGRALTAWAAVTFVSLTVGLPLAASWVLARGGTAWAGLSAVDFLLQPLRPMRVRALWVGVVSFGRRLLFAALVGLSDYAPDGSLPVLIFLSLVAMLLLQASARARARSNWRTHRGS
jgi:hypothetical protein